MNDHDRERLEAAAERRRKKLERYISTPGARAARAITEAQHDTQVALGRFIPTPAPYDLGPDENGSLSSSPGKVG